MLGASQHILLSSRLASPSPASCSPVRPLITMEAVRRCCSSPRGGGSCRRFLLVVVVVLLLSEPAVCAAPATISGDETSTSLSRYCPSLDACRGGVPNLGCCTAINDAVNKGECSCVCKQLKIYNHGNLARDCNAKWCNRCGSCRCAMAVNGPYTY